MERAEENSSRVREYSSRERAREVEGRAFDLSTMEKLGFNGERLKKMDRNI